VEFSTRKLPSYLLQGVDVFSKSVLHAAEVELSELALANQNELADFAGSVFGWKCVSRENIKEEQGL